MTSSRTHTHHLTFTPNEVHKRFVSWDNGEADREWACLMLLADRAPGIAPRPLRRETRAGAPVIVMERLAGTSLGGEPLTAEQTSSLGAVLRSMYDIPIAAAITAGITERRFGPTELGGVMRRVLADEHDLSVCRDPSVVAESIDAAHGWLELPNALPEPHLVAVGIADLNPANILWDGTTCRLVDFEDGGLTDPAFELADHLEHIAGRLAGTYAASALVDSVGLTLDEQKRLKSYRPLWAAFWLAMLLPGNSGFTRNPPGTTEAQAAHLLALLDGLGTAIGPTA